MRLIDADALKEYVKKVEDNESAYTICAYIDNAPTIEELPKGKWISTGRTNIYGGFEILCSNCKTTLMVSKCRYEIGENYCDVCGAKMIKEDQT